MRKHKESQENPAIELAARTGVWSLCPACLEGFLDLHCTEPSCKRLRCRKCDFIMDPTTERFILPIKKKRIEVKVE